MAGALARHPLVRQPVQRVVDERHQPVERLGVAVAPGEQQLGDFLWRLFVHRAIA